MKKGKCNCARRNAARGASSRKRRRRQPTEEAPGQTAAVVENDARGDGLAIWKHFCPLAHDAIRRDMRFHPPSLRAERSNPAFVQQLRMDWSVASAPATDDKTKEKRGDPRA